LDARLLAVGLLRPLTDVVAPLGPADDDSEPLDLRETDLRDGCFAGADLRDANLSRTQLKMANLAGAQLRGASLVGADLSLADLRGADLQAADLSGADLTGADIRDARFDGADLTGTDFGFARIAGARGLSEALNDRTTSDGRVDGQRDQQGDPKPATRAYAAGVKAHRDNRIGDAERYFREALCWVPESDIARYALGCACLDRRDPAAAVTWWHAAIAHHHDADRARLEAAIVHLWLGDTDAARAVIDRPFAKDEVRAAVDAFRDTVDRDRDAAVDALARVLGDVPGVRWFRKQEPPKRTKRVPGTIEKLSDEEWVAAEQADLAQAVRGDDQPVWFWHGAIARAITIGAMEIAALAEQRLTREAPEYRLWGLELRELDISGQAFESLVRTRAVAAGAIRSVRWVAIGAHGPTARIDCDNGIFYAKRYIGATRPPASVAYTHRVVSGLDALGLTVPAALPDAEGADTLPFSRDQLALYPDVGGRSIDDDDLTPADAHRIGAVLARIHELGDGLDCGARPVGGVRIGTRILRHHNAAAVFESVIASDRDVAIRFAHHPHRARVMSLLQATSRRLSSVVHGCRTGLVHGDFGPGNVLINDANEVSVVDWDLCDSDLTAWDLARCIDRVAVRWPLRLVDPLEIRANVARAVIEGYESVRPLHHAERAALPVLVAASRVDLDATVLAICAPIDGDIIDPMLERLLCRLGRAAAGVPEIGVAICPAID